MSKINDLRCGEKELTNKQLDYLRMMLKNNEKGMPVCSCDIKRILVLK